MSDVLDSHEGRRPPRAPRVARRLLPPGWRPHWSLVLLALVALSAGATALVAWRVGGPAPSTRGAAPTETPPPVVTEAPPSPSVPRPVKASPFPGRRDPLLVVTGGSLYRVGNGAINRVEAVDGADVRLLRVNWGTFAIAGGEPGSPSRVWLIGEGTDRANRLGLAEGLAPGADGQSAWLVGGEVARKVDAQSGKSVRVVTLPPDTQLVSEVVDGFVLRPLADPTASYVWDATSRRTVRRLGGHASPGTDRHVVVRTVPCESRCTRVVDTGTGGEVRTDAFDRAANTPALSPDGRWLVGWVGSGDETVLLQAFDTKVNEVLYVKAEIRVSTATTMAWDATSRTLYLGVSDPERGSQVLAWSPPNELLFEVNLLNATSIAVEA